jgi:hypothetical protein
MRDILEAGIELRIEQNKGRLGRADRRDAVQQARAERRFISPVTASLVPTCQITRSGLLAANAAFSRTTVFATVSPPTPELSTSTGRHNRMARRA